MFAAHDALADLSVLVLRWRQKQLDRRSRGKRAEDPNSRPPVSGPYPTTLLGVTSEAYADALGTFVRTNPGGELRPRKGKKVRSMSALEGCTRGVCWLQEMHLALTHHLCEPEHIRSYMQTP